jgi:signal transduction histidine kinase
MTGLFNTDTLAGRQTPDTSLSSAKIAENLRLARSEPGRQIELSWLDSLSKENFKLSVQIIESAKWPVWRLVVQPSWSETISLLSMSSADPEFVRSLVLEQASHETRLRQLVQIGPQPALIIPPVPPRAESEAAKVQAEDGQLKHGKGEQAIPANVKFGSDVLLGDLLLAAELATQAQVAEALARSDQTGLHVGRILTESGVINEKLLRAALMAQSQIRDGMLHSELASKALALVAGTSLDLPSALKILGWRAEYYQSFQRVARLLLDSGCATREALLPAMEICFSNGLTLCRVLLQRKVISSVVAYTAVSLHALLSQGKIKQADALSSIKIAESMNTNLHSWLKGYGMLPIIKTEGVRLGELLTLAGLITEIELIGAVERGLLEKKPIGQVFIDTGLITDHVLQYALELQSKVGRGEIGTFLAADLLNKSANMEGLEPGAEGDSDQKDISAESLHLTDLPDVKDPKALFQELLIQRQNLAYKVVSQEEEVKHRVARDLHDSTIANLLVLRRFIAGERELTNDEIVEMLDAIVHELRDLCNDFAPRQLHDWGLQTFMQDLAERFNFRTSVDCSFSCNGEIPSLPEPVELHIYRIAQECLNNIEKYSKASMVSLEINSEDGLLRIAVSDNGQGLAQGQTSSDNPLETGGTGMRSMSERAELIRCYFPTKLSVESSPGKGVSVVLELTVASHSAQK